VDKTVEVYLSIPSEKQEKKVLISVNGAFHELDAMTTSAEAIPLIRL
jgi:hypothetical protein